MDGSASTSTPKTEVIESADLLEIVLPDMSCCKICGIQAHGKHFGALTCRACAAFFRRCHFNTGPEIVCQFMNSKCKADNKGRWACKKCRFDRCIANGMTTRNIQCDRDLFQWNLSDSGIRFRTTSLHLFYEKRVISKLRCNIHRHD